MNIGEYLKQQREAKGFGLRELGRRIGYPHSYLSDVERGIKLPSVEVLTLLASELDEDLEALSVRCDRLPPDVLAALRECPERIAQVRAVLRQ